MDLLQEKLQLRLKVLEDGLRPSNSTPARRPALEAPRSGSNGPVRRQATGTGSEEAAKLLANGSRRARVSSATAASQLRASISGASSLFKNGRLSSKSIDMGRSVDAGGSTTRSKAYTNGFDENLNAKKLSGSNARVSEGRDSSKENVDFKVETANVADEPVSSLLYDMLQKEVITLRKSSHEKDQSLKDKDDAIEVCLDVVIMFGISTFYSKCLVFMHAMFPCVLAFAVFHTQ